MCSACCSDAQLGDDDADSNCAGCAGLNGGDGCWSVSGCFVYSDDCFYDGYFHKYCNSESGELN